MALELVEGWTQRIRYQLLADDDPVDLTGCTVEVVASDKSDAAVTFSGSAGVATAATGIVYFDPASTDLKESKQPYRMRWKVTDGSGKVAFYPRKDRETWKVVKA